MSKKTVGINYINKPGHWLVWHFYMEITTVSYHKVFNLGNFSNEKIGVDIKIAPGEDPLDAFAEAKKIVEKSHKFFQDLPAYESALKAVQNPDDYTGRDIKRSQDIITAFEINYPDYITRFSVSRQLTEGAVVEDFDNETRDY